MFDRKDRGVYVEKSGKIVKIDIPTFERLVNETDKVKKQWSDEVYDEKDQVLTDPSFWKLNCAKLVNNKNLHIPENYPEVVKQLCSKFWAETRNKLSYIIRILEVAKNFDRERVYFKYDSETGSGWRGCARPPNIIKVGTIIGVYPGKKIISKIGKFPNVYKNVNALKGEGNYIIVPEEKINIPFFVQAARRRKDISDSKYYVYNELCKAIYHANVGCFDLGTGSLMFMIALEDIEREILFAYGIAAGGANIYREVFFTRTGRTIYAYPYEKNYFGPLMPKINVLQKNLNEINLKYTKELKFLDPSLLQILMTTHEKCLDELSKAQLKKLESILKLFTLKELVKAVLLECNNNPSKTPYIGYLLTTPTALGKLQPEVVLVFEFRKIFPEDTYLKKWEEARDKKKEAITSYKKGKYVQAIENITEVIKTLTSKKNQLGDKTKEFILVCYSIRISCCRELGCASLAIEECETALIKAKQWFKCPFPAIVGKLEKKLRDL